LRRLRPGPGSGHYEGAAANTFLDAADYYLVAHAHTHDFDVVTPEDLHTTKKIKIPDAYIAHGVKTMNTFALLHRERARLVLAPDA
jgi:hypothetical protein